MLSMLISVMQITYWATIVTMGLLVVESQYSRRQLDSFVEDSAIILVWDNTLIRVSPDASLAAHDSDRQSS